MKLTQMSIKGTIRKTVIVDTAVLLTHSIGSMDTLNKVWRDGLSAAGVVPNSIKVTNSRILSIFRNIKVAPTVQDTISKVLPNITSNLQHISEYIVEMFPNEYQDEIATVKQKVAMAYLGLGLHMFMYFPDLVNHQLATIRSFNKREEYDPPARKLKELDDGLFTFAIAIDLLGIATHEFVYTFDTRYPEVAASSDTDALLAANHILNPIERTKDNFRGNPLMTIGSWMNTQIVDYVKYMDDRLRVAKLYKLELERKGDTDLATAKEIALLNDEISDLEYRLYKATK